MKMRKGFTLFEILIGIVISILVMIALFVAFDIGNKVFFYDTGLVDLQQEARQAMDGMIREIRQAKQEAGRPLVVGGVVQADGGDQISFFIPGYTDAITYTLVNNQIIREHPKDVTMVLANDITTLSFCCQGGADCADCGSSRFVQVQLQAQKTVRQRQLTFPAIPDIVGSQNLIEEVRLRQ
jgi:type II secretory pathway pseudopilin PulG